MRLLFDTYINLLAKTIIVKALSLLATSARIEGIICLYFATNNYKDKD